MHSNLLDVVLAAGLAAAVADGVRRGIRVYLPELGALVAGLLLAFMLFRPLGQLLHQGLAVHFALAGFGSFLLLLALGHGLAQKPAQRGARWAAAHLRVAGHAPARLLGGLAAAAIALVAATVLLSALAVVPAAGARALVSGSMLGSRIASRTQLLQVPLRTLVPTPAAVDSRRILDTAPISNPGEGAFYKLRFPAELSVEPDPAAEEGMLRWINNARRDNGLSALRSDTTLQAAAREHSRDMYLRHYFSHQTPDGKTPYDRLHELHFRYVTAGENIAFAPDAGQAWDSLMHSPDHRANILNPDFRCVGVGALKGVGGYEEMFTQDFADCS